LTACKAHANSESMERVFLSKAFCCLLIALAAGPVFAQANNQPVTPPRFDDPNEVPAACDNIYPSDGPFYYMPSSKPPAPVHKDRLLFVSYNVNFNGNEKGLITDFNTIQQFKDADFILLQEITGTIGGAKNFAETLAKIWGYHALFAPAIVYHGKEDYGNAILSRWPITDFRKVVLPRSGAEKCNQRIAVGVTANVRGWQMQVYAIHLATIFPDTLGHESWRPRQMKPAIDDMNLMPFSMPSFIAGDLNTVNPFGWHGIEKLMDVNGFINTHPNQGWTHKTTHTALDHTFSRTFEYIDSGNIHQAVGSDHIPVWTEVVMPTSRPH
jgi:endonuclease/exonuclease/phosphatase family metal-dependent hydrolase